MVGIDWFKAENKMLDPPIKPQVDGENWLKNFDYEFISEDPVFSYAPKNELIEEINSDFQGISYMPKEL